MMIGQVKRFLRMFLVYANMAFWACMGYRYGLIAVPLAGVAGWFITRWAIDNNQRESVERHNYDE